LNFEFFQTLTLQKEEIEKEKEKIKQVFRNKMKNIQKIKLSKQYK